MATTGRSVRRSSVAPFRPRNLIDPTLQRRRREVIFLPKNVNNQSSMSTISTSVVNEPIMENNTTKKDETSNLEIKVGIPSTNNTAKTPTGIITTSTDAPKSSMCDFYANPTILSRLILHQKYASAIRRLEKHPREALIWVCRGRMGGMKNENAIARRGSKDGDSIASVSTLATSNQSPRSETKPNHNTDRHLPEVYNPYQDQNNTNETTSPNKTSKTIRYSYMQLPIHMATQNLSLYPHKSQIKAELEILIVRLIQIYPAGCKYSDHRDHFPLHTCLRYSGNSHGNQNADLIRLLLMAAPSVLDKTDHNGQTAMQIHRMAKTTSKADSNYQLIENLLNKGKHFWEIARAKARAKRNETKSMRKSEGKDQATNTSMSTVWSDRLYQPNQLEHSIDSIGDNNNNNKVIKPLSWSQLEQRTVLLEQLLTETHRQNHKLQKRLQVTTAIFDHDDEFHHDTTMDVKNNENQRLRDTMHLLVAQNQVYLDRISELEESIQLVTGNNIGYNNTIHGQEKSRNLNKGFYAGYDGISSLTMPKFDDDTDTNLQSPPRTKCYQPPGMYGDESPAITPTNLFRVISDPRNFSNNNCRRLNNKDEYQVGSACSTASETRDDDDNNNYSINDQDESISYDSNDLDSILIEAQVHKGTKLSAKIVEAWKAITFDQDGLPVGPNDEVSNEYELNEITDLLTEYNQCVYANRNSIPVSSTINEVGNDIDTNAETDDVGSGPHRRISAYQNGDNKTSRFLPL